MYIKLFKAKIAAMEGLRRLSEAQPKERDSKVEQVYIYKGIQKGSELPAICNVFWPPL